jgi:glycosyltransferase involved in cell wall biosynthesis
MDRDEALSYLFHGSKRVLIWYWGRRGGGAQFTRRFLATLKREKPELSLGLSLADDMEGLERVPLDGIAFHPVTLRARQHLFLLRFWAILKSILCFLIQTQRRYDTIIITMNFMLAWPLVYFFEYVTGSRVVFVVHDATPHPGDVARRWQLFTQAALLRVSDAILCLSNSVCDALLVQKKFRDHEIIVRRLDTFTDDAFFAFQKTQQLNFPVRFLFAGRIVAYKGLDRLAEACKLMPSEGWTLTVAGDGPEAEATRSLFSDIPQVELHMRWLSEVDMFELFETHDVLVCPYSEASQSGVIVDALQFGLRILVTPVGGLHEQIEGLQHSRVAQSMNAEDFAAAMRIFLDEAFSLK